MRVLFFMMRRLGGKPDMAVAACTPGTTRRLSSNCLNSCARDAAWGYVAKGSVTENVTKCDRLNPASTCVRLWMVRTNNPAPMTRITANVTSAITRPRRTW